MKSLKYVYTLLAALAIATTLGCAATAKSESTRSRTLFLSPRRRMS